PECLGRPVGVAQERVERVHPGLVHRGDQGVGVVAAALRIAVVRSSRRRAQHGGGDGKHSGARGRTPPADRSGSVDPRCSQRCSSWLESGWLGSSWSGLWVLRRSVCPVWWQATPTSPYWPPSGSGSNG